MTFHCYACFITDHIISPVSLFQLVKNFFTMIFLTILLFSTADGGSSGSSSSPPYWIIGVVVAIVIVAVVVVIVLFRLGKIGGKRSGKRVTSHSNIS